MRTLLISLLAAFTIVGAGCAPASVTVPFGTATELSIGETVQFVDGLRVTLVEINDSRCAAGVTCIWQGELAPIFNLSGGTLSADTQVILGTERNPSKTVEQYIVGIDGVTETVATISVTVGQ